MSWSYAHCMRVARSTLNKITKGQLTIHTPTTTPQFPIVKENRNHVCLLEQDRPQQPFAAEPLRAGAEHCRCSVRSRDQHCRSQGRPPASAVRLCARGEISYLIEASLNSAFAYKDIQFELGCPVAIPPPLPYDRNSLLFHRAARCLRFRGSITPSFAW